MRRISLPYDGVRPGDEVVIPVKLLSLPRTRSRFARPVPVIAAAAVLAIAMAVVLVGSPLPAVAHVSFDINPSVQLSVDALMRVVSVSPFDEPSESFLEGMDLVRKPLRDSIVALTGRAAEVLPDAGERWLILSAAPVKPDGEVPERVVDALEKVRERCEYRWQEERGEDEPLHTTVIPVPGKVAEDAREAGVSTGHYVLLLAAEEAGVDTSALTSNRAGAIIEAIKDAGCLPGEVLGKAKTGKGVEGLWHDNRDRVPGREKDKDQPGDEGQGKGSGNPNPGKPDDPGGDGNPGKPTGEGGPPGGKPPNTGKPDPGQPETGKPTKDKPGTGEPG